MSAHRTSQLLPSAAQSLENETHETSSEDHAEEDDDRASPWPTCWVALEARWPTLRGILLRNRARELYVIKENQTYPFYDDEGNAVLSYTQ